MLTGTPLDLTPFGGVLQAIGLIYWLLAIAGIGLAIRWSDNGRQAVLGVALVLLVFGIWPGHNAWLRYQAGQKARASMDLFAQRCKTAGEKIHKTVDNVDGVVWMKWRPKSANLEDQFELNDPYGHDCSAEDCILQLLRVTSGAGRNPKGASQHKGRYDFVETVDPSDGKAYRYRAAMVLPWTTEELERFRKRTGGEPEPYSYSIKAVRESIDKPTARYGITWDDLSTREDREHWIAGGSLKAIDLQTNEVIAERIGYMIDQGQGSKAGERSPWAFARDHACPSLTDETGKRSNIGHTGRFVFLAVQPTFRE